MMIADVLMSTAAIIVSIALLVMAVKGFRRIEASVGQIKVVAEQIDKAVNNVGPNEPPLRALVAQLVARFDDHVRETDERLARIENEVAKKVPKTPRRKP
jgi:hypothetical protein